MPCPPHCCDCCDCCEPVVTNILCAPCSSEGDCCPSPRVIISGPSGRGPGNTSTRSGTFRTPDGGNGRWTVTETSYDSGCRPSGSRSGSRSGPSISLGTGSSHGPPSFISSQGPSSYVSGSGVSGSRSHASGSRASRAPEPDIGGGWTAEAGSPAASVAGSGSVRGNSQVSIAPSMASSHRSRGSGASSQRSAAPSQISGVSGRSDASSRRGETILPSESASQVSARSGSGAGSYISRRSGASGRGSYISSPLSGTPSQRSGGSHALPGPYLGPPRGC